MYIKMILLVFRASLEHTLKAPQPFTVGDICRCTNTTTNDVIRHRNVHRTYDSSVPFQDTTLD